MTSLLLGPTSTAQWQALLNEAQTAADQQLNETLESYLVFLLDRYTKKPEIANTILALEYLESLSDSRQLRQEKLRDIGDQCLLFSGLFPQRAQRRRVRISYFVDLGRNAYHELSNTVNSNTADLFNSLAHGFVILMDVLQAIRRLAMPSPCLTPIESYDLWCDTGSRQAYETLREYSGGIPIKS